MNILIMACLSWCIGETVASGILWLKDKKYFFSVIDFVAAACGFLYVVNNI